MWIVVSFVWSIIIGTMTAAWAFGEFIYRSQAGYHFGAWALGAGILMFIFLLYTSYKARANISNPENSQASKGETELSEFLDLLRKADNGAHGIVAAQATDVASRIAEASGFQIDLRYPAAALAQRPALLWELEEEVISMQKAGRQADAPGTIAWVHTLRAEQVPELRPAANEMWKIIGKGTGYMREAAYAYHQKTSHPLLSYSDLGLVYSIGIWPDSSEED
jgi:hypothetical protein